MKLNKTSILILCCLIALSITMSACKRNGLDLEKNDTEVKSNPIVALSQDEEKSAGDTDGNIIHSNTVGQYDVFMKKAEAIETYSKENYETATTQTALNTESYAVYVKWDSLLNEVFQYLKSTMNVEEFSLLEAEEDKWIKEKEKGMDDAAAEWEGGSGEPLARNSAGIQYTSERCYFLISLVK